MNPCNNVSAANFIPEFFISYGRDYCFYTLRRTSLKYIPSDGPDGNSVINGVYQGRVEITSTYVRNLSTCAEEAIAKAKEIAGISGTKFKVPTVEQVKCVMNDIRRTSAEEMERLEQIRVKAAADRAEAWEAQLSAEIEECRQWLKKDRFGAGKYVGKCFNEAPKAYMKWMIDSKEDLARVHKFQAEWIADIFGDDFDLPTPNQEYAGEIKKRQVFTGTVIKSFSIMGYYGRTYCAQIVDEETGGLLVSWTTNFAPNTHDRVTFKATVKGHGEYEGQNQTTINRIADVEYLEDELVLGD